MSNPDLINILKTNELHGSWSYLWNDGWRVALPYEYIVYSIIVGTMLKVLLQYVLWKYMKSTANSLLWIPSMLLTLPSFLMLYKFFTDKPLFIYIVVPITIGLALTVCESYLQKGIKEFNWIRKEIV